MNTKRSITAAMLGILELSPIIIFMIAFCIFMWGHNRSSGQWMIRVYPTGSITEWVEAAESCEMLTAETDGSMALPCAATISLIMLDILFHYLMSTGLMSHIVGEKLFIRLQELQDRDFRRWKFMQWCEAHFGKRRCK